MRIYVAASSDELDRAAFAMEIAREHGFEITFDWVSKIRAVGQANPVDESREQRQTWALDDLAGVEAADAVWLLAPSEGHARGAFFEMAHALACGIPVIVSGPTHACSIFTALATAELATDTQGLAMLMVLRERPRKVPR